MSISPESSYTFTQPIVCVDVETDGGDYRRGHVIEIAAIRIEDGKIVDEYSTLLNPGISVPSFISRLTGITTSDLEGQPSFDDIAERLLELFDGAIFVAHNVRFDYSFIKQEFARVGIGFTPKMLCTVRLSRALHPGVKGHKLSDLISRHQFHYLARHRAYDDAHVLWQFLQYAQQTFTASEVETAIARQLKLPSLPRSVDQASIDALPHSPGVYVFKDHEEAILYIGKSIDIKKRVMSHFTRDTSDYKEFKIAQQVQSISHIETSGEMSALLLESQMIKDHQPLFNRNLRRRKEFVVATILYDTHGYATLIYRQLSDIAADQYSNIMGIYDTRTKAKASVLSAIRTFSLCPKLCGLEKGSGSCFSYQIKKCYGACIQKENVERYNDRLRLAFERTSIDVWPYEQAITVSEDEGHTSGLVVDQWRIIGRFFRSADGIDVTPYEAIFDIDAYKILRISLGAADKKVSIMPFHRV